VLAARTLRNPTLFPQEAEHEEHRHSPVHWPTVGPHVLTAHTAACGA
jgi:hypothetical protein